MDKVVLMSYYNNYYSSYKSANDAILIGAIVGGVVGLILAIVFGIITKKINESKGYSGGFAWGFFLGLIGIIVVAVRKDNHHSCYNGYGNKSDYESEYDRKLSCLAQEAEDERLLREGGWKCIKCGRVNASFSPSCDCGRTKYENDNEILKQKEEKSNVDNVKEEIEKYKNMLDEGLITQEEFELKKKSILKI